MLERKLFLLVINTKNIRKFFFFKLFMVLRSLHDKVSLKSTCITLLVVLCTQFCTVVFLVYHFPCKRLSIVEKQKLYSIGTQKEKKNCTKFDYKSFVDSSLPISICFHKKTDLISTKCTK